MLVVAHGTASVAGRSTVGSLVSAVARARPTLGVDLCYLDVLRPTLGDALDDRPTVVVPALLSTGFHVQADIPAAVEPYPDAVVARHLGPHPLLTDALLERLGDTAARSTVLVAAGSSRLAAAAEVREQADLLAGRLRHPVATATVTDDLPALFADTEPPFQVATYLLADGRFTDVVRDAAAGRAPVSAALGAHPKLVELIWLRYDDAVKARARFR